ncbi:MAG: DUF2513 domain-containing protein [Armatimonadota bacterium]|nr:DUF2513 domain-containing protein [Armatimonadota bacterium]
MRRDMNLIRKLILELEDVLPEREPNLNIEGYTEEQVRYHLYLLYDAGLVYGMEATAVPDSIPYIIPTRLSWRGHEFADNARDERHWKKTLQIMGERAGSASFEVVTSLLTQIVKQALGLGS